MTQEERDKILNELHNYAIDVMGLDLSGVIEGFKATKYACTHEVVRISKAGYFTCCQCGKICYGLKT
jgi:hypothetical protein